MLNVDTAAGAVAGIELLSLTAAVDVDAPAERHGLSEAFCNKLHRILGEID